VESVGFKKKSKTGEQMCAIAMETQRGFWNFYHFFHKIPWNSTYIY